jgi:hypothetical protein
MRTMTVALGFLMLVTLVTGHVDTRPATPERDRVSAAAVVVPMPTSAPAGVEMLLLVR